MAGLTISIAVCCHNSTKRLPQTLGSLLRQRVDPAINWEVVVIDNGSTDDTAATARALWPAGAPAPLRVVPEPRLGLHHARRCAFQQTTSAIVSFVDDDNWLQEDWVQTAADIMRTHPEVGACGGRTEPAYESTPPSWMGDLIRNFAVGEQAKVDGDATLNPGRLWGAGVSIRRTAWDMVFSDGFDLFLTDRAGKALSSGGDSELCYALRLAGWRLHYSNRLSLQHYMPAGRLRWDYLTRLYHAFGVSQVILDVYEQNLEQPARTRPWSAKLLGMAWRTAKLLPKVISKSARQREGNEDYLRFQFCLGYLQHIWTARGDYQALHEKITALAARLRAKAGRSVAG